MSNSALKIAIMMLKFNGKQSNSKQQSSSQTNKKIHLQHQFFFTLIADLVLFFASKLYLLDLPWNVRWDEHLLIKILENKSTP